jgi:hypothetical protein
MKIFSLLASIFSKKIIDNVTDSSGTVSDYINNMGGRGETYDEFIKRIKGNSDENKKLKNNYVSNTRISTYKWFR